MNHQKQIARILSVCTALLLWQGISSWIDSPEMIPSVVGLFTAVAELFIQSSFYTAVAATVLKGCIGICAAIILALPIGFLCGKNSFWRHYFTPLLSTLRSTPVVAFILLIILWFPPEFVAPVIALMTMFPVLCENIIQGVQSIDPEYEKLAGVYKIRFRVRIQHIYYPALRPFVESGAITAFGFGWKAIIMGEVLSKPFSGIGVEMKLAQTFIDVPVLVAWTLIAIVVSFGLTELLRKGLGLHYKRKSILHGLSRNFETPTSDQDIVFHNVTKQFETQPILNNISGKILSGSIGVVTGASGQGKSTLLDIIAGYVYPDKGNVSGNTAIRIGYMFQTPLLLPWLTIGENILLTAPHSTTPDSIQDILKRLEIDTLLNRLPHQLSGGEQRRVSLARALASKPDLLLIDEPFSGMDKERSETIAQIISEWNNRHGTTLIVALHEPSVLFRPNLTIAL